MFWRNINNIHNYNEKGFLCVVNLFNEARNTVSNSGKGSISFRSIDYRFSRVYLLRFTKGQLGPRDIDLNNNNIGRRVMDGVIKCLAPVLQLRNYLEGCCSLNLKYLRYILRSRFQEKSAKELYSEVGRASRGVGMRIRQNSY